MGRKGLALQRLKMLQRFLNRDCSSKGLTIYKNVGRFPLTLGYKIPKCESLGLELKIRRERYRAFLRAQRAQNSLL